MAVNLSQFNVVVKDSNGDHQFSPNDDLLVVNGKKIKNSEIEAFLEHFGVAVDSGTKVPIEKLKQALASKIKGWVDKQIQGKILNDLQNASTGYVPAQAISCKYNCSDVQIQQLGIFLDEHPFIQLMEDKQKCEYVRGGDHCVVSGFAPDLSPFGDDGVKTYLAFQLPSAAGNAVVTYPVQGEMELLTGIGPDQLFGYDQILACDATTGQSVHAWKSALWLYHTVGPIKLKAHDAWFESTTDTEGACAVY